MKKVLVFCLLVAASLLLPACLEEEAAPEGQLPILQVGTHQSPPTDRVAAEAVLAEEIGRKLSVCRSCDAYHE